MTKKPLSLAECQEITAYIDYEDSKITKDLWLGIGGLCITGVGAYLSSRYGVEWSPLIIGGAGTSVINFSLAMGRVAAIDYEEGRLPGRWPSESENNPEITN